MNLKVSANESDMENISVKSRPMNIVSDYKEFVTTQWLEVKDAMDEAAAQNARYYHIPEKDIINALCNIITVSIEICHQKYWLLFWKIGYLLDCLVPNWTGST